jgi:hypothetical protein
VAAFPLASEAAQCTVELLRSILEYSVWIAFDKHGILYAVCVKAL